MRISDWSSDVCSSDLRGIPVREDISELLSQASSGPKAESTFKPLSSVVAKKGSGFGEERCLAFEPCFSAATDCPTLSFRLRLRPAGCRAPGQPFHRKRNFAFGPLIAPRGKKSNSDISTRLLRQYRYMKLNADTS